MRGKTSGIFRMTRKKSGFTLIELLIVVVIMAILVGVVGSLLAGFYDMFDATTDSASARRRANDVFDILKVPISNAGVGMPGTNLGVYFEVGSGSPLEDWAVPVEVISGDNRLEGNALKVVYALPTGIKNGSVPNADIDSSGTVVDPNDRSTTLTATSNFAGANFATRIVAGRRDVRAFIAFPGGGHAAHVRSKCYRQPTDALGQAIHWCAQNNR